MAFVVEEYPNCLILPTDWTEKKKMNSEDALQYAYDNNYTCFNYNPKYNDLIFFYKQSYDYCRLLAVQKRHYDKNVKTVILKTIKTKILKKRHQRSSLQKPITLCKPTKVSLIKT